MFYSFKKIRNHLKKRKERSYIPTICINDKATTTAIIKINNIIKTDTILLLNELTFSSKSVLNSSNSSSNFY